MASVFATDGIEGTENSSTYRGTGWFFPSISTNDENCESDERDSDNKGMKFSREGLWGGSGKYTRL